MSKTSQQNPTRRKILIGSAAAAGGLAASLIPGAVQAAPPGASSGAHVHGQRTASTITTNDGTQLCYKDWGSGRPVVLCHGRPLSSDSWESQMMLDGVARLSGGRTSCWREQSTS